MYYLIVFVEMESVVDVPCGWDFEFDILYNISEYESEFSAKKDKEYFLQNFQTKQIYRYGNGGAISSELSHKILFCDVVQTKHCCTQSDTLEGIIQKSKNCGYR